MDVVILAAGKGNRLKPITDTIPKTLIEIGGVTMLERILNALPSPQTKRVFVVIHHLGEMVKTYMNAIQNRYPFPIFAVEQTSMNGTYGALETVKDTISEWFVVLSGDDMYDAGELVRFFEPAYHIGICQKHSRYFDTLFDVNKNFLGFDKTSTKDIRNVATGCYTLNKNFFNLKPYTTSEGEYGLPQTLEAAAGNIRCTVLEQTTWEQLNTFENLAYLRSKYEA